MKHLIKSKVFYETLVSRKTDIIIKMIYLIYSVLLALLFIFISLGVIFMSKCYIIVDDWR